MEIEKEILKLLPVGYGSLDEFLSRAYPADTADFIMNLDKDFQEFILQEKLTAPQLAELVSYFDYETQHFLSRRLSQDMISQVLGLMYPDDAVDFLGSMPVGKVKNILSLMREQQASELQRLLDYDDESAGGLMTSEFLAFYSDNTADQVIKKLREISPEAEMIYYIYVISRTKEMQGVLSMRQLLAAPQNAPLSELMSENVIKVDIGMDQEEVAHIFSKYDLLAVPVVNKKNQLVGIITVDDAIDVMEEEATEDIYKMAATADVYRGGMMQAVKKRLPWLLILLVGDLLSGSVIKGFETSLQTVVALAFFIPVLMDMGGNVGTQSLTVVVRGLATGELHFSSFWNHLWREIKVGMVMALLLGAAISVVALVWQGNPILGVIVGVSMFITLLAAVLAGTSIPYIIHAAGADPAVASGPFITTLIDISGLFIYFTMATILMEKLI